jgi:hypothetical protein
MHGPEQIGEGVALRFGENKGDAQRISLALW